MFQFFKVEVVRLLVHCQVSEYVYPRIFIAFHDLVGHLIKLGGHNEM